MNSKRSVGYKQTLVSKLRSKRAAICIIGLGYVGLPLALKFCELGYKVVGIDIDPSKVSQLNNGQSYIEHITHTAVCDALKAGLKVSSDFSSVSNCEAIIICVPTPLNKYREPDLSFVKDTTLSILPYLRAGQVLSLESTTYPGTTDEVLLPVIASEGLEVGVEFFLVYSPEREDPGNLKYTTSDIPKVVGGHTQKCLDVGVDLYGAIIEKIVPVSSTKAAEMTKLLENIHRAVNIGLVNEMKIVADRMGIDIFEVIDAASTKPFGFTPYYPGPGLGGHCIPIDPFYLTWKAREFGLHTRFIELSGEINQSMPEYVVSKLADSLNRLGLPLKGRRILVLGIAYKKNVDDMRESPAVKIMELLKLREVVVAYSDPHVPKFPQMRDHKFDLASESLNSTTLNSFDAVILCTDHDKFDYDLIRKHSKLIVDSRGKYRQSCSKIIKA